MTTPGSVPARRPGRHRALRFGLVVAALAAPAGLGCRDHRRPAPRGEIARIITLTPSSTEMVAAAGGLDRIVGVDHYSRFPAQVDALPEVGDFINPRIEAILALEPDLVVLDEVQRKTADKLDASGVAALVFDVHGVADVRAALHELGEVMGTRAQAAEAVAAIDRVIAAVRVRAAGRTARPRVLIVVGRRPGELRDLVAAGPGSYLDELVGVAGGDNVMAAAGVRYPHLSADRIVEAAPDVVLDATHGVDPADWRALERVPAIAQGRVHGLTGGELEAPSPRAGDALLAIERLLFP